MESAPRKTTRIAFVLSEAVSEKTRSRAATPAAASSFSAMPQPRVYERGSDEFTRVLAFSDAVYAIAMTLLVVGIGVPALRDSGDEGELLRKLGDLVPELVSFFLSFAVIGRYWMAHHQFFGRLRAVDGTLIGLNLVYLGFVAFLPFPTGLLGNYFDNPISVCLYAVAVAAVSGLEVVLFARAYRAGLLRRAIPAEVFRWGAAAAFLPVVFFLLSVPVAFANTVVAVVVWFLALPAQALLLDRRKPARADELLA
jgi:TMEM175 potassium channel family protein